MKKYNPENKCGGCTSCNCGEDGQWICRSSMECGQKDDEVRFTTIDDAKEEVLNALDPLAIKTKEVFSQDADEDDVVVLEDLDFVNAGNDPATLEIEKELLGRRKRSVKDKLTTDKPHINDSITFHNTVDELNEDTIKNETVPRLLTARKFMPGKLSRRTGTDAENNNKTNNSLHIEFKDPHTYNHIPDKDPQTEALRKVSDDKIKEVMKNDNLNTKDKDLSKLVVNELKKGTETVGDVKSPVVSNITFTPENDTLNAVVHIAGNLLNKLWKIERESTGDSIETDILKHEKIADLIELFKEPLTLRQETFLKNTLQKLSEAIDETKSIDNVSICKKVQEVNPEKVVEGDKNCDHDKTKQLSNTAKKLSSATSKALSNINNVIHLVQQFEKVNLNLNNLKKPNNDENLPSLRSEGDTNQFTELIKKLTEVLIPGESKRRKTVKKIRKHDLPEEDDIVRDKLSQLFNIDLDNLNLTPKDKILYSYLSKVEKSPKCLFDLDPEVLTKKSIEGNILLNLSQFLKIKSISDLLKTVDPGSLHTETTTMATEITTTLARLMENPRRESSLNTTISNNDADLSNTKEKLKSHLKSILEDINELQNAKGPNDPKLNISDILPCVYKLLHEDQPVDNLNVDKKTLVDKIRKMFEQIKDDKKFISFTRKSNADKGMRPKSAIVWERTVKNINNIKRMNTRRNEVPKKIVTYRQVKRIIDGLESVGSEEYKKNALKNKVKPSERTVLLKAIDIDLKHRQDLLELIKVLLTQEDSADKLNQNELKLLDDFIDRSNDSVILTKAVMNDATNNKLKPTVPSENQYLRLGSLAQPTKSLLKTKRKPVVPNITREQLLNQLIRNRATHYISAKKRQAADEGDDSNTLIAKTIIENLDKGNDALARELYKVFIASKLKINPTPKASRTSEKLSFLPTRRNNVGSKNSSQKSAKQKATEIDSLLKRALEEQTF